MLPASMVASAKSRECISSLKNKGFCTTRRQRLRSRVACDLKHDTAHYESFIACGACDRLLRSKTVCVSGFVGDVTVLFPMHFVRSFLRRIRRRSDLIWSGLETKRGKPADRMLAQRPVTSNGTNQKKANKTKACDQSSITAACYLCNTLPKTAGLPLLGAVPLLRVQKCSVIVSMRRRGASRGRPVRWFA